MTPEETVRLIAECRAMYPGMAMVAGMPQAWHEQLGAYDADTVRLALTQWAGRESRIPALSDIRATIRAERQAVAHKQAAQRALRTDGRRHAMPSWFRAAVAESLAENAGKYRERHEARRAAAREAGKEIKTGFEPMPGWLGSTERSPQERQAGPDA